MEGNLPWQMENDLGPLYMSQEVPDFTTEKMENLCQQVLEVTAGNIKKAKAHQAEIYNAMRWVQKCGKKFTVEH